MTECSPFSATAYSISLSVSFGKDCRSVTHSGTGTADRFDHLEADVRATVRGVGLDATLA